MIRYDIGNQIIEERVLEELDRLEIKYFVKHHHDSVYDGIYEMTEGYGFIEIEEKDAPIFNELFGNIKADISQAKTAVEDAARTVKKRYWIVPLVIIPILIAVVYFVIQYGELNRKYNLITTLGDIDYKWNSAATIVTDYDKKTQKVVAVKYDENKNGHYEKRVYYDKAGNVQQEYYSAKDDGNTTYEVIYQPSGEKLREYYYDEEMNITKRIDYYQPDRRIEWSSSPGSPNLNLLKIIDTTTQKTKTIDDIFALK